jgi:hypothetical protein
MTYELHHHEHLEAISRTPSGIGEMYIVPRDTMVGVTAEFAVVLGALVDAEKTNTGLQASLAQLGSELARVRAELDAARGTRIGITLTAAVVLDEVSMNALVQQVGERLAGQLQGEVWLTEADEEPKGGTTVQNEAGDLWSRPAHGYAAWTPCWFSYTTNEALRWMDLCQGYGPVKVVEEP